MQRPASIRESRGCAPNGLDGVPQSCPAHGDFSQHNLAGTNRFALQVRRAKWDDQQKKLPHETKLEIFIKKMFKNIPGTVLKQGLDVD